MAVGIKRLRRIQLGKETVAGTAVAATTRWRGGATMLDDQRKIEEIEEWMGVIDGADRTAVVQLLGMLALDEVPATAEQFQYLAVMGLGGSVTGSADGAGSDKIYTTNTPTTAKPTAVPYTIQGGDDFEVEQMEYTVCSKISLKGALGQTARMGATLMGRQVARLGSGFSAGATIPSIGAGEFPTQKGKLFLDAIGGAYGTTQISNLMVAFQVDIEIMWQPVFTIDGNLYFSYPSYTGHKISGQISYLHDTGADGNTGEMFDFRNQTPQLLRLDLSGDAVASPGTLYSTRKIIIDCPIKYLNPGPLGEDNGNDLRVMKFRSRYNTTAGNQGKIVVVNELTTLP
jgi:hypothetical protein